jgi:threonine/homoserine/homoserine lactone efflux protein
MVSPSTWLAFALTALAMAIVPGPSVLFIVSRGIAHGRQVGLATVAGNSLGSTCHVIAVAVGLGALIQRSTVVFSTMKWVGALFLIWLGIRAFRHRHDLVTGPVEGAEPRSAARVLTDGFTVGITNPKTTLFFLAVLPQFVEPSRGRPGLQLLQLGLTFVVIATFTDSLYALGAGAVRRWIDRSPRRVGLVGGTSGLVMMGLGVRLALTGRRD